MTSILEVLSRFLPFTYAMEAVMNETLGGHGKIYVETDPKKVHPAGIAFKVHLYLVAETDWTETAPLFFGQQ